uniref:Tocopherol cyclase n=1 Tax=Physcomitrium patens TaxID=3218 RepID=A0A7I4FDB0_PHYPA
MAQLRPVVNSMESMSISNGATVETKPRKAEYLPMPADRATRTPHSGYHFDGTSRRFFEGWYFKVSIPEVKQSFAWMYTSELPGSSELTEGEVFDPSSTPSGAAQVMGADEEYLLQDAPTLKNFWAARHELALGNTYVSKNGVAPPKSEVDPKVWSIQFVFKRSHLLRPGYSIREKRILLSVCNEFWDSVEEGYQVTPIWHQGCLRDNGSTDFAKTVGTVRWEYSTRPVYGWGSIGERQLATAGWLAVMPVFEPHWQICMAGGLSTGWIEWGDRRFEFEDAPSYCEKNWGGAFPQKWFWMQCNVFDDFSGEVALTAGGGRRGLPLLKDTFEDVALVAVHFEGKFYEFVPWEGKVEWDIAPWGSWKMTAQTKTHEVKLEASTDTPGCLLRAPTVEGFKPICTDSFAGNLKLQLWERNANGSLGKVLLEATSSMCALETGGSRDPWKESWTGKATMRQPLKTLLQLPINPEKFYNWVPGFKPPGF